MALFRKSYDTPGPGVEKDETPKPGYIRYWQLYFRNFNKMLGYSVVYFFVMLPLILFALYFVAAFVNPDLFTNYFEEIQKSLADQQLAPGEQVIENSWTILLMMALVSIPSYILIPLVLISAIAIGPLNCGIAYCMRNHAREDHAWFTDMFVRAWRNKKQGLIFGFIDFAVVLSTLIYVLSPDSLGLPAGMFTYLRYLGIAIFIIYMVMRWYIYQMIVTFNLNIRGLLKNAWMFVLLGAGRNLVAVIGSLLLIAFFLLFPVYYPYAMPYFIPIIIMLFWGLLMFLAVFSTYPVMHRYLVAPALAQQRKEEEKKQRAEAKRLGLENPEDLPLEIELAENLAEEENS